MKIPDPTPIYRITYLDNLRNFLCRKGLHAHNYTPDDGLVYRTIHNVDIQMKRHIKQIPCGPGGVIHNYVPFYFGPRSPMLLQLHTGRVDGHDEGQEPIIYLVATAQAIVESGVQFVFSDGHGIATYTKWFNNLEDLDKVDWDTVKARSWNDHVDDMDRQRRKQAEFLVYRYCDWALIQEIAVINGRAKSKAENIMNQFPDERKPPVRIRPDWYY